MKAYSIIFVIICLNLAAFTICTVGIFPMANIYQWSTSEIESMFAISAFDIGIGIAGSAILGVILSMLKTYTFAAGAIVLWVVTIIFKPLRTLLLGFPTMITNILLTTVPNLIWFSWIVSTFFTLAFFILFIEIISGRQIT